MFTRNPARQSDIRYQPAGDINSKYTV